MSFKYKDSVYFLDHNRKISVGVFSEYWHGNSAYIKNNNNSLMINIDKLFNNELDLLLFLENEKIEQIEANRKVLAKIKNNILLLENELLDIKNNIKKNRKIND